MKVAGKGIVVKVLFVALLSFVFDVYGFLVGISILMGREVSQVEYRWLEKGHHWDEITWRVYVDIDNWKARDGGLFDTIFDIVVPFVIGMIILIIR